MEDLLFLAHRIPYPPNKGDKIRSWNILRHLAENYRIHLGCFVDDPEDWQYEKKLRAVCADCMLAPLHPFRARLASTRAFLTGDPLTLAYYRSAALSRWVDGLIRGTKLRRIFVFSSSMAQFVPADATGNARLIVDFVDVDSDKWAQYAARKSFPANWVYRREARTLAGLERRIAMAADTCLLVSDAEAALFRDLVPDAADHVFALNNGVDYNFFDPEDAYPDPYDGARNVVVFTGQMDYWANVDAVQWFARDVFPLVRQSVRDARFCIVGANPSPDVLALNAVAGVDVTGRVPDVRPYLHHARAVAAPLRVARGVQNKVLEAMAMAKTIVATPEATDGISARPDHDFVVASGITGFAEAIIRALSNTRDRNMETNARETVISNYSWGANLSDLNKFLENPDL